MPAPAFEVPDSAGGVGGQPHVGQVSQVGHATQAIRAASDTPGPDGSPGSSSPYEQQQQQDGRQQQQQEVGPMPLSSMLIILVSVFVGLLVCGVLIYRIYKKEMKKRYRRDGGVLRRDVEGVARDDGKELQDWPFPATTAQQAAQESPDSYGQPREVPLNILQHQAQVQAQAPQVGSREELLEQPPRRHWHLGDRDQTPVQRRSRGFFFMPW